jgi:hypothetical protein
MSSAKRGIEPAQELGVEIDASDINIPAPAVILPPIAVCQYHRWPSESQLDREVVAAECGGWTDELIARGWPRASLRVSECPTERTGGVGEGSGLPGAAGTPAALLTRRLLNTLGLQIILRAATASPTWQTKTPPERGFRRADDGARTRDPWLGKPMLYQLSYVRLTPPTIPPARSANGSSEGWPIT